MRTHLFSGACYVFIQSLIVGCVGSDTNFRVAVIRYQHETCTFCPGGDTEIEDWTRISRTLLGDEGLEAGTYIRGFADRSREFGDIKLLGITSPDQVF